jgi:hypothetical protein
MLGFVIKQQARIWQVGIAKTHLLLQQWATLTNHISTNTQRESINRVSMDSHKAR